jgi:hypothetical protein
MTFNSVSVKFRTFLIVLASLGALLLSAPRMAAQETTGGLQGTVKDPTGAVVPGAKVALSGAGLVADKESDADSNGAYHFLNVPPGTYTLTATATGFETLRQSGLVIQVGHLPTIDLTLQLGAVSTTVEVTSEAPQIDVTTNHTITNVTQDVINDVPHGRFYQSVIQFAPAARDEPLAGNNMYGQVENVGTGGASPGSGSNGNGFGYSVAGGSDSENSYLVDGQETANIVGGYSHVTVPFEFIQEVQIKTGGIEAQYGGSLGGVVNVVTKKGGNDFHGAASFGYESSGLDAGPNAFLRYNPNDPGVLTPTDRQDPAAQTYQPKKDHFRNAEPSFGIGGPIKKDKLLFYVAAAPYYTSQVRDVDFSAEGQGVQNFTRDNQTYYTYTRLDYIATQKIRLFGSWIYQYQRESGAELPTGDPVASESGFLNTSTGQPLSAYSHGIGFAAPAFTMNYGGDITLTPRLVLTTRFGYYFENYHDFGYPTSPADLEWETSGVGGVDTTGAALPASLALATGTNSTPFNQDFTTANANKHDQFDVDLAWFKSGWGGSHNFVFGYQLNHLSNFIGQVGNVPNVQIFPGSQNYAANSTIGLANCAALKTEWDTANCQGKYGYINVVDYGTAGHATNYNHGLFAQDSWTVGKGLTLNLGIRIDKEYLPSFPGSGLTAHPINFGWGDKVAPRIGAAWDVFRDGKMKVFGSYGVFNDIMKLNLAISSFGGQFYQICAYGLSTSSTADLEKSIFVGGRACPTDTVTTPANWEGGVTPPGLEFIENFNLRATENVVPGLKPYRQHESNFGVDYQLARTLAFEARWDRRRLDHAIEDAAILNADTGAETFTNVNPGQGVDSTFNGFSNFLYGSGAPQCNTCPALQQAARSYDGVEFRLTKSISSNWYGMFSYTYSHLRGNYSGLTSTDESDGFGGRNAPNNSRAFDEPYFQETAYGTPANGLLATDRPNVFKGYTYYSLPWGHGRQTSTIGLFQQMLQGSPMSTFLDVGAAYPAQPSFPVYPEGRGKWATATSDPSTGDITISSVGTRRTPWYTQSDLSLMHSIKVNGNNESQVLSFEADIQNLFNQRAVTAYYSGLDSFNFAIPLLPGGLTTADTGGYAAYMSPYPWKSLLNTDGVVLNTQYGKPWLYQYSRNIRLSVKFEF